MRDWFKFHTSWLEILNAMEDEEAGILLKQIFRFVTTGERETVHGIGSMVYGMIISQILKDEAFIESRRINGSKGGRPKGKSAKESVILGESEETYENLPKPKKTYGNLREETYENLKKPTETYENLKKPTENLPKPTENLPKPTENPQIPYNNNNINNPTIESTSSIPTTVPIPTTVTDIDNSKPLCNSVDIGTPLPGVQGVKRFVPPTLEEVRQYIADNGYPVDPDEFFDRNTSVGWVDKNGNKYKDWKAVVRTWARFRKESGNGEYSGSRQQDSSKCVLIPGATPIKHGIVI